MADPGPRTEWNSGVTYAGAIAWTALVLALLLLPAPSVRPPEGMFPWVVPEGADKLIHAVLFFVEALVLSRAFRRFGAPVSAALAVALALALGTEMAQHWIPERSGDGADFLADACGIAVAGAWASRPEWTGSRS